MPFASLEKCYVLFDTTSSLVCRVDLGHLLLEDGNLGYPLGELLQLRPQVSVLLLKGLHDL